ncbi:hypothetical protein M0P98_09355 [bacterium]|nr:hypothetical protein [bacterium]
MTVEITGEHGIKSEDQTEEIFNQTFFADFTFRSPRKDNKYEHEITDVLIGFDDVLLIVQVKSQKTDRDPRLWLPSNLRDAVNQLSGSINYLKRKKVIIIKDTRRGNFDFNIEDYKYIYGLVLIDQPDKHQIDISGYTKEFYEKHNHSLQIMSLKDFNRVCSIFDTAEEVLHYYDMRHMFLTANNILLHNEDDFLDIAANHFSKLTEQYRQFIGESKKDNEDVYLFIQQEYYQKRFAGIISEDYKYSKIIDGIIDHCHNFDSNLYNEISIQNVENIINPKLYYQIAHELAKTGRLVRILHGQKIMSLIHEAEAEGYKEEKDLTLTSKSRKTAYHYYIPNKGKSRKDIFLCLGDYTLDYAKKHPELNTVISVGIEFDGKKSVRYQYLMVKK